jgi:hypothetical protein
MDYLMLNEYEVGVCVNHFLGVLCCEFRHIDGNKPVVGLNLDLNII